MTEQAADRVDRLILRLRRWQVRLVAIGMLGAGGVLAGGATNERAPLVIGAGVFAGALAAIFVLGGTALVADKRRRLARQLHSNAGDSAPDSGK